MSAERAIRVLLVDDHAIVREGYRSLLSKQADLNLVGEAAQANEAYLRFKQLAPDVTVMDLSLPGQSGLTAITHIRNTDRKARILTFSMHRNPQFVLQAMHAGALGYVSKSSTPETLIQAIRDVYCGRRVLSPDLAQALALEKTGYEQAALDSLSAREFEILRLLANAKNRNEIAVCLNLSPKTVSNCHYLIKRKLGVDSDIELIRFAIKMQVISVSEISGMLDSF